MAESAIADVEPTTQPTETSETTSKTYTPPPNMRPGVTRDDRAGEDHFDAAFDSLIERGVSEGLLSGDAAKRAIGGADDTPESESAAAPGRDEKGRFVKKDAAPTESETTEDSTVEPEGAEANKPRVDSESDDYKRAVGALVRDGIPKDVLDRMAKENPDALLAWGNKRAKVQRDVDGYTDEMKALKAELESLKSGKGGKTNTSVPETAQPTTGNQPGATEVDYATLAEPFVAYLKDTLGEDAAAPAVSAFKAFGDHLQSEIRKRDEALGQFGAPIQAMQQAIIGMELRSAKNELASKWPQLKEPAFQQAILGHMDRIGLSDAHPDLASLMDYACQIETAPQTAKQAQQHRAKVNAARDVGTPAAPTAKPPVGREMTDRQLADAIWDAKIDGNEANHNALLAELNRRERAANRG